MNVLNNLRADISPFCLLFSFRSICVSSAWTEKETFKAGLDTDAIECTSRVDAEGSEVTVDTAVLLMHNGLQS